MCRVKSRRIFLFSRSKPLSAMAAGRAARRLGKANLHEFSGGAGSPVSTSLAEFPQKNREKLRNSPKKLNDRQS